MDEDIQIEIKSVLNDLLDEIEYSLEFDSSSFEDKSDPFELVTKCDSCKTHESSFWRRIARNKIVCNKCFLNKTYLITISNEKKLNKDDKSLLKTNKPKSNKRQQLTTQLSSSSSSSIVDENNKTTTTEQEETSSTTTTLRKSSRFTKTLNNNSTKQHQQQNNKTKKQSKQIINEENNDSDNTSDGSSSRRNKLFKNQNRRPNKNETCTLHSVVTSDFVFHRGVYMQIGDVVALYDLTEIDKIYFAQIRAFITDQYGHKSAVITWLIPSDLEYLNTIKTSLDFDPNMFVQGPAEEYARPLECNIINKFLLKNLF